LACGLLLLAAPRTYANGSALATDLDGDGRGDRVVVTQDEPSLVRVWLSTTSTTHVIRSAEPVLAVALAATMRPTMGLLRPRRRTTR
jgi:hypothetical protein